MTIEIDDQTITKVADILAYQQVKHNNPKADSEIWGYRAFSQDQRDWLIERQKDNARDILVALNEERQVMTDKTIEKKAEGRWDKIPGYDDYEIHSESHIVRECLTKEVIEPGFDPEGKNQETYIELLNKVGRERYVQLNWIIESALKGKKR